MPYRADGQDSFYASAGAVDDGCRPQSFLHADFARMPFSVSGIDMVVEHTLACALGDALNRYRHPHEGRVRCCHWAVFSGVGNDLVDYPKYGPEANSRTPASSYMPFYGVCGELIMSYPHVLMPRPG